MSTATTTGTIVFPASPAGSNQTIPIGAPDITAASTTGATLTYTEGGAKTLTVTQAAGIIIVSFDTIASADILYVGTDEALSVVIDGSATAIELAAGGFIMIQLGSIASMTVAASTINTATVLVAILGA